MNTLRLTNPVLFYRDSLLNSYGQIFFSDTKVFSILLLIASFVDPMAGLCGLVSLAITVASARIIGLNEAYIRSGAYGYNSLMTGMVMGVFYQVNLSLLVMLFFGSVLTLFLTVWFSSQLSNHRLPYLSLPFIAGVWVMLLSARSLETLQLSERGVYAINELWGQGGFDLLRSGQMPYGAHWPWALDLYFKSMGAVIFQYNLVSGVLIAVGLVIYSRIAFSLSVTGFYAGYLFCYYVQGNIPELEYSYVGFNFILTAIALGGFFLIPSRRSFLLVIFAMPLVCLLIGASTRLVSGSHLPVYSLPFSLIVLLMMYVLGQRPPGAYGLTLTPYQRFSPERNFYSHRAWIARFGQETRVVMDLPFYGTWKISQGHDGAITHREDWRYALDFVVTDDTGKTFALPGTRLADFYCYGLPVIAPAPGEVVTIVDGVQDNQIGGVNLTQNWGNTVVVKHDNFVFSKLSHLRKGSFQVKVGDHVQRGAVLATCGNSGHSPEPHLHFQIQASPYVGAATVDYPFAHYITQAEGRSWLHSFEVPSEGESITRPALTPLLKESFRLLPGMKLKFETRKAGGSPEIDQWEVCRDSSQRDYIYCHATGSCAYFVNNESLHYFFDFTGSRNSLLYYFYLANYKIPLGYYARLTVSDEIPLDHVSAPGMFFQDLLAPFKLLMKAGYQCTFAEANDALDPTEMKLVSSAQVTLGKRELRKIRFELTLRNNAFKTFKVIDNDLCIVAEYVG